MRSGLRVHLQEPVAESGPVHDRTGREATARQIVVPAQSQTYRAAQGRCTQVDEEEGERQKEGAARLRTEHGHSPGEVREEQ